MKESPFGKKPGSTLGQTYKYSKPAPRFTETKTAAQEAAEKAAWQVKKAAKEAELATALTRWSAGECPAGLYFSRKDTDFYPVYRAGDAVLCFALRDMGYHAEGYPAWKSVAELSVPRDFAHPDGFEARTGKMPWMAADLLSAGWEMDTTFVNLTPHAINIGERTIPASGSEPPPA